MPATPPAADAKKPATPPRPKAPADQAKAGAGGKDEKKAPAPSSAPTAQSASAEKDKKSAGASQQRFDRMAVRAKLPVSRPGDPAEREADQVADRVMRQIEAGGRAPRGSDPPGSLARTASSGSGRERESSRVARATSSSASSDARKGSPKQDPVTVSRQAAPQANDKQPSVPTDFAKDLGAGVPLDASTRALCEPPFGRDLTHIRVHDDGKSDAAARTIGARAFTIGNHIAFASGQFQPETQEGRRLLTHEITHVLQQEAAITRMIMRNGHGPAAPAAATGSGGGAPTGAPEYRIATNLEIPPIKSRHATTYQARAGRNVLRRPRGYSSATRATAQISHWLAGLSSMDPIARLPAQYRTTSGHWNLPLEARGGGTVRNVTATSDANLLAQLQRPNWDVFGDTKEFQVDHMVEFQLGGQDEFDNLELLDQAHNGSVGPSFNHAINTAIRGDVGTNPLPAAAGLTPPTPPTVEFAKQNYDLVFTGVQGRGRESRRTEKDSRFWSRSAIQEFAHVTDLLPGQQGSLRGKLDEIVLLSPTGSLVIGRFPVSAEGLQVPRGQTDAIAGFNIESVELTVSGGAGALAGNTVASGTPVGRLLGVLNLGPAATFQPPDMGRRSLAVVKGAEEFSIRIGATPVPGSGTQGTPNLIPATFEPLSPMEITDITFGRSVFARAWIQPSHPLLAGLRLPGEVRDGRIGLFYTVDATSLAERVRVPGLAIDAASITLGYDGQAFSVSGGAELSIRNFGQGQLRAGVDSEGRFELEGGFRADPRLFDRAEMHIWYRSQGGFGGTGTLGITNPNKIRGIRSASVTVTYEDSVFSAEGSVQPSIPGVQNASLRLAYGPDESGADSLRIAGDLALAQGIPGISGGTLHVDLAQREEAWKVSAIGDIQPQLPGLNPNIHLTYDDGLFTGEVSAAFRRGIFSGDVTIGLTNRAVSPDGELSDTEPGERLSLYGAGTINARLTDWLQGGVGVKVKPTGVILISGRIGIPDAVTVFEQYPAPGSDRRTLFSLPTTSIPLFGAPGAGVTLNISGRVDGYAHIGPGRLTTAEINVLDFNPAQPESLHITGTGVFDLPGEAGVAARLDAGLAAGAVISLEAGLGVSAGVAVEAHVRPSVNVDWTQSAGLHLHAALNASLGPKLKFDVIGYVRVIAGALGISYELWRKDWELAQREVGSSLTLGINVPVDYYSDGRGVVFDPRQVTFQVPPIGADTLSQLLNDSGQARTERGEGRPPT